VSPAPENPSFADVATTDLGYQYIEALAASGITGGCGGGNYCPDTALTRRQMAILSRKGARPPLAVLTSVGRKNAVRLRIEED
jgi:hypothetical protein